jgi:O-antigen/teichoic acid export membrane protein
VEPLDSPDAGAATIRGGGLRALAWAGSAALSLISIPLLVRHLGVPEFGRYVTVLAIVNIAVLASDLGLAGLALREWSAADPADRPRILRALLGMRLAFATAGAVAAITFTAVAGYPARLVAGTALCTLGLFALVFGDFALVGLAATLRFGRVAFVEFVRAAVGTAAIALLVLAGAGLLWFFAAWSLAALVAAGFALRLGRGTVPLRPRLRRADWRPLLGDTAAYAAATAVHVLYFRVVMVVTSLRAGARQAGLFATVFRIIEFTAAAAGMLAATATPVLARAGRDDPARLRRETRRIVGAALAAGVVTAAVLELAAPLIMDLIGGNRTDAAVPVMRIAAPAVIATFASFAMGAVLLVLRRYRELLAINVATLALALGLALALVPAHGARGAAVAVLASEWFLAVAQAVVLVRALGSGPGARLPSARREL